MSALIRLAGLKPFVRGGRRGCYVHPEHPDRCIKVLLAGHPVSAGRDENRLDYEAYGELERFHDATVWNHIPRCYGLVDTDLGPGLVTEYLTGPDGLPAPTLSRRIEQSYDASTQRAVEEFKGFLLKHLVRVGDLRPSNLVISARLDGEQERIFIIDGLGNQNILWWRCFRPLRPFKLRRKLWRLGIRIEQERAAASRTTGGRGRSN